MLELSPRPERRLTPRRGAGGPPQHRSTKPPFFDAGLLEETLNARARLHQSAVHAPVGDDARWGSSTPRGDGLDGQASGGWPRPTAGDRHEEEALGVWHRSLRGAIAQHAPAPQSPRLAATTTPAKGLPPIRSARRDATGGGVAVVMPGQQHAPRSLMALTPSWLGGVYCP